MNKLYTILLALSCATAMAQQPTNLGTNIGDGITYQTYVLYDNGAVRSMRIQAQTLVAEANTTWEFYTGDYNNNWRPYQAGETLAGYNVVIDPATEAASARYNSNYGGQSGHVPDVQAGRFYTFIVGTNVLADNRMSVIETDFDPVGISTVDRLPVDPAATDVVTVTVTISTAQLSAGEHVFVRYSTDGFVANNTFAEVTNWSSGSGTVTIPAQVAGTTVTYYALVTKQTTPSATDVDYHTLYFGNNGNLNYSYTIPQVPVVIVPTMLGSNIADGITYSTYPLTNHGVVSTARIMAQNDLPVVQGTWEFFFGDYYYNWRPYDPNLAVSGYDAMIDPTIEPGSARYNTNYGGQTGHMNMVGAGKHYTFVVQTGELDNKMSVLETDFAPVNITAVSQLPVLPTNVDNVAVSVTVDANALSPGEFAFVRYTTDGWASSFIVPVSTIAGGMGTATIPALPSGTVVEYYALITEQSSPDPTTIDYLTLSFGNNNNLNYTYTVDTQVGVANPAYELLVIASNGLLSITGAEAGTTLQLLDLTGRTLSAQNGTGSRIQLNTADLATGHYLIRLAGSRGQVVKRVFVY